MSRIAVTLATTDPRLTTGVSDVVQHLASCGFATDAAVDDADLVLVWADERLPAAVLDRLLTGARPDRPLLLAGPTLAAHADAAPLMESSGLMPERVTPVHETRLRPGPDGAAVAARLAGDVLLVDRWLQLDKTRDDVDVLLTAMVGLAEHPVMTWRPSTGVGALTLGNTAAAVADPAYRRLVHRWVRHALGLVEPPAIRIGLLGYGAIGAEHAEAAVGVDGLALGAVVDKNPARLDAVRALVPDVTTYDDPDRLIADDEIDLVVVSTPPNTHDDWVIEALGAGKHVVVEKPFAITTAGVDAMMTAAAAAGRTLAVYQNRRWDADFLALERVLRDGVIGEVFHYESFVGGYGHPCNFWHSDEEVSGGAVYDWGSHYLYWMLQLMPQPIETVTAATHKRVWHDVTNADHSRVTVRFVDGAEAEFVHSDLAAAMKPKWYVLGTRGAVVGDWRTERVVGRSSIGTLVEETLAAAESPATLSVHGTDGSVTALAIPPAPRHPFHRELADQLLTGAPMSVTAERSRRTVAVMEAAAISARENGRPVVPQ